MSETTLTPGRAAAEWWAEQLGAPVHKATTMTADDPDRAYGEFAFMAMQVISARHPMSSEQGEVFVGKLAPVIDGILARTEWMSLGVDYGPDLELARAAEAAGIDLSRFPWKTHMSVTPMYVTASLGYHGATRLIWQHADWERPACGSMRYEQRGDSLLWFEEVCGKPKFHEDADHGDWTPDTTLCTSCGKTQAAHWNEPVRTHTFKHPGASR